MSLGAYGSGFCLSYALSSPSLVPSPAWGRASLINDAVSLLRLCPFSSPTATLPPVGQQQAFLLIIPFAQSRPLVRVAKRELESSSVKGPCCSRSGPGFGSKQLATFVIPVLRNLMPSSELYGHETLAWHNTYMPGKMLVHIKLKNETFDKYG